ncbi:hypothetical protein HOLleu_09055 [Holothuria leucospilota]|uniref:Uncharacterized protein n=1 Tax=Holothuria leucospilota TaxID=206669 RepID=A0A9Q1CK47_HOLLE|nr:hypothetical protein HOLleu_09055 [Holothuria leucospilota]
MSKRQRSHTSEDADGTCKGKRLSAACGRPGSAITSPLLTLSESSQSDNEVDIVWGHSPPPLNLNLHTTPGPKTRRKSDYTNKDIADMIECIHSRNSSQQSPTISTPPLLGLWMQGRQDVEKTPVGAKGHRLSRKLPSRKPSTEAWASLAKDLHMLAEASKDFPLSQQPAVPQPAVPPEGDSEDILVCQTYESLHTKDAPECQNVSLVTPERFPPNQNDRTSEDSPMAELWGDDSWFETDSVVRIATQLEEQEASKKLEGADIDAHSTVRGNNVPQTMESSGKNLDTNKDKNALNGFTPAVRNTNVSSVSHSNHQFTSPPNCRRLSRKQMFQKPSECNLKKENSTKGRASFRFSTSKESVGLKKEGPQQFLKQGNHLEEANSLKLDKGGNNKAKEASVVKTGRNQFVKDVRNDISGKNTHAETANLSFVSNTKTASASSAVIGNSNKTFEPAEEVLDDCNESMDLFEASIIDEEVERTVRVQENSRSNEGHLNFQHTRKGAVPVDNTNKLDSDLPSDLSFIDEELLAAVELEEMHWEEISSQHGNEVVETSKTRCTDNGTNQHSFMVPHPVKSAGSAATGNASNQTVALTLGKRLQSSQFSFKSSQKNSQKGVKQVVEEHTSAKNTGISLSTQQMKSPVHPIVDHNNRMNQISGKHEKCVNQFSAAATDKKGGKRFERIKPLQFSSSQSVQFQQKKSAAKVENNLSIQNVKLVPTTLNSQVSIQSSNFSPFKAPVSSQFVKSTTSESQERVFRTDSLAPSEKDIASATLMKKQIIQPAKSSKDTISLAKKDSCTTTGTSHPVCSSVGKKLSETVSSSNGSNAVQPSSGSRDTFQLGKNLPERRKYGQTSTHLSQFQSGSKDRKSEKTSNSSMSHSRIRLRDENNSDNSFISRYPGEKTNQFQTKPSHTNILSVNQVTSNSDFNSSAFSQVSSQFSSSSQVKCNETCSEVTPSPVFTTNTVRPPVTANSGTVTANSGTVTQPPETGTSWSVLSRHSTDNSKTLQRKAKGKEMFSAGTLNAKSLHHNQFSQFSKAKKEHLVLDNLSEGESFLTSEDHLKEDSVCTFKGIKERLKETVQHNHVTVSDGSHISNFGQKTSSQFVQAGHVRSQSSPLANKRKPVLTTVTNVYANDVKQSIVPGCAKQFSRVSRTSSAPNGVLVSFQNEKNECAETRKDSNLKSSQKTGVIVNLSNIVKTSQGNSNESTLKSQNQLQQPRTNTVTITPSQGPKTRRKSDYTNKDIADMIECIHSRNSSQQSPTISTPPLLGLWMQGRQDVEKTPVGAKGQRLSRKLPSRKPSTEAWASLAKDLHMLAEASKDFPLSQQPAVPPEGDSEDTLVCQTYESLHTKDAPECRNVSLVTPERFPPNQNDRTSEDSPMAELWGDDSWFETDSVVRIATQLEEQEASKKLEGADIDAHSTVRGNNVPQTMESSGKNLDSNKDKNSLNGFTPAVRNTNVSSVSHSNHQFTSPPNCRRLSRKQMFQKPSECNLKKENSTKGRASFRFSASKESVGPKKEGPQQFLKQGNHLEEANSLKLDKGGNNKAKEASVVKTGRNQFVKDVRNDTSGKNTHAETANLSFVANTKTASASSAVIGNSNKTFEPAEEVLDDCNESMDLFEASIIDEEVERTVRGQENSRSNKGHLNFQHTRKGAVPLDNTNKLESDLPSDLSFIDEELLAAVELEEMHWEEISSQHGNEVVKTSKTRCTDNGTNQHSFTVPHPVKSAGSSATGNASNQTVAPTLGKRLQSSQFSFKSSQKNSQKGVKQVVQEHTSAKNTGISPSTQQMKSPVHPIVDHNNRMNQISGKHEKCVNQFSAAATNKKGGKQFERIKPLQFSSSQSEQFQQKKSAAKVENNLSIQNVKLVPTTLNSQVSIQSSNFSPFKAPVSSQFVKSTTSESQERVFRTDSLAPSEKDIASANLMKKQIIQPAKSSKDPISLAKKDSCTTTGTSHAVCSSVGKKVSETVSSSNGSNAVQPSSGSRDTFQLGENLPERRKYGQTSTHLSQFQSGSKDRKSEKTFNSSMSHSRISLRDENKSDNSFISRNPGVKTSNQFQTKPSHTNILSVNQVTSNSDLNSSAFSQVSSQFSSSSQVKCNDTCSEVTPSPVFTINTVRPPVTANSGTVTQPPETGTSWSVLNRYSTDNSKTLQRKAKGKEMFSAGTLNAKSLHHNQFSQFSKAKKEHLVLDNLSEGESFLTSEDHLKDDSVCTFQGIKEGLKETVQHNHVTVSDGSHISNFGQKTSSQFIQAGHVRSQSSPLANKSKPVLTTVTNVYANDVKQSMVPGCAKQFSRVSRTSSAPNGVLVSFQNEKNECAETRKDSNLKSSQKTGVVVNLSTIVKTSQGSSNEFIWKSQNQLQQPRTNTVTITPSQDKRPCSQEQIEQKRREALARKKRRENLIGNHSMNLRERTIIKK